ncbi:Methyltransferase-like protein 24 [Amphibalanus amphitrite]|uniref:Methyltransferase-like protein 24 n=1 Tax=Amphibalanus amphitrite TaxID=1232801 RepID=A0A6A4WFN0_AMPAM|nr:Methyltransferase-like protein 24 [Amphibalanus amphitrite]
MLIADTLQNSFFYSALAESIRALSEKEVLIQLEHVLSPSRELAQCRSIIYPGGKCQCVDASPNDEESCTMLPILDGKKTVCLDDGLLPPGGPCLVYSFGIRDDLSFETEMVRFGCTVHAFDPTVRLNTSALPDGLNVHYLGVDGRSWTHHSGGMAMQLMTLTDLVRHLGHEGRQIDYIKLDAEGSEWSILNEQLTSLHGVLPRVPQLHVEFHLLFPHGTLSADPGKKFSLQPDDAVRFLHTIRRLEAAGFRMFESRPDFGKLTGTAISLIYETTWIRK